MRIHNNLFVTQFVLPPFLLYNTDRCWTPNGHLRQFSYIHIQFTVWIAYTEIGLDNSDIEVVVNFKASMHTSFVCHSIIASYF